MNTSTSVELDTVLIAISAVAMAAATIALGRDEGAYEEQIEAAMAKSGGVVVCEAFPRKFLAHAGRSHAHAKNTTATPIRASPTHQFASVPT